VIYEKFEECCLRVGAIYSGDIGPVRLLAYSGDAIRILLANTLSLGLAFLKGVFILELGTHCDL